MTGVIPFGTAKVQTLPFNVWDDLREIETLDSLVSFLAESHGPVSELIEKRTSPCKSKKLFESCSIKKSEAFYLSDTLKSAALRAGGSSIMSWAPWAIDKDAVSLGWEKRNSHNMKKTEIGGCSVELPVNYTLSLPSSEFEKLARASRAIHNAVAPNKIISRTDYVAEIKDDGVTWNLVDIGESNLTLALTDALHEIQEPSQKFLNKYVSRVLEEFESAAGYVPQSILLTPENDSMASNMHFEFSAAKQEFRRQAGESAIADVGPLSDAPKYDLCVRYFRIRRGSEPEGGIIIEDTQHTELFKKAALRRLVSDLKNELGSDVYVPQSDVIQINKENAADEIYRFAERCGIQDLVIKPSEKRKGASPIAYFCNAANPLHREQLNSALSRLAYRGVETVIAEEAVGNASVDGRKMEVRVTCFG